MTILLLASPEAPQHETKKKSPMPLQWVHCLQNSELDSCFSSQLPLKPSRGPRKRSSICPRKNCLQCSFSMTGREASQLGLFEGFPPVCLPSSKLAARGQKMRRLLNQAPAPVPHLANLLASLGMGSGWPPLATVARGNSCPRFAFPKKCFWLYFYIPSHLCT